MKRDYDIAESELDLIYFHCKWRGNEISEGLYRLSTRYAGTEFRRLLEKHNIPWELRRDYVIVSIDFQVEREETHSKIEHKISLCDYRELIT